MVDQDPLTRAQRRELSELDETNLLTTRDVARMPHVSEQTVRHLDIPHSKVVRYLRYKLSDVISYRDRKMSR